MTNITVFWSLAPPSPSPSLSPSPSQNFGIDHQWTCERLRARYRARLEGGLGTNYLHFFFLHDKVFSGSSVTNNYNLKYFFRRMWASGNYSLYNY